VLHERVGPNVPARFGLGVLVGGDGLASPALAELAARASAAPFRLAAITGVDWLLADDALARRLGAPLVASASGVALARNPVARPRAFVAPRSGVASREEAFARLLEPFRGVDLVRVELAPPAVPRLGGDLDREPPGPCEVRSPRPERVELRCTSRLGGHAVLLDAFAPGWSATVDGRAAPILEADGLYRAVPVGPGEHAIVFAYRTPGLRAGAAIALVAWVALAVALLRTRRRRGEPADAPPAIPAAP
jgi:hypothetical protein